MTMAPGRHLEEALPISARERAILCPDSGMHLAAIPGPSQVQKAPGFRASRSEHRAAVARLARSRRPGRAAKSP